MENKLIQQVSPIKKVVLYGPESTGKTTLAKQLASHYQTLWIPEYARAYLQTKWDEKAEICAYEDLVPIAQGQMQSENKAVTELVVNQGELLICDTDLLETSVYSQLYFDKIPYEFTVAIAKNFYDLYLLTDIDVPWQKDDLRDRPDHREEYHQKFHEALKVNKKNYITISGSKTERLTKAITAIDKILTP
ncbi:MAG: nicotinate-nucleotide adenylyltransferase [Flavobacteriaceae bacterium]|nr:nicotinate-nucleotide adenylyltransferase [Flavobacteriaceae bacterium]